MIVYMFDTETTGLIDNMKVELEKQPYVIEYCGLMVDLATGEELSEDWFLVKPADISKVDKKIIEITNITPDILKDAPPFRDVAPSIKKAIEGAPIVLAHNLAYDMDVLTVEFARLGQTLQWPQKKICTIEQTIHVKSHRLSMSALHAMLFDEPFDGAHRARVDVQAMKRCCVELHRREML